jgi:aspartyl/asparaginyl beta-hydroxylase (cupin superfamily)
MSTSGDSETPGVVGQNPVSGIRSHETEFDDDAEMTAVKKEPNFVEAEINSEKKGESSNFKSGLHRSELTGETDAFENCL